MFLDLKKAFDTVDHNILLDGTLLPGVVSIKHDPVLLCEWKTIKSINYEKGIPQGSGIGSLLFLIHINDIFTKMPFKRQDKTRYVCE